MLLEDCNSDISGIPCIRAVVYSCTLIEFEKSSATYLDQKTQILLFLAIKDKYFPQFKQTERLSDFVFAVDLFEHMN